jgi:hypothetical protein
MRMEDDVDAPDGVELDGDVDVESYGDDDEEEDEEEEDEEKKDDVEVEEEDQDEEEDDDEDDDKEPGTNGQREMVMTSGDNADTMVEDQPTVLPEHGQEMPEHTQRAQPVAPTPRPQTPESSPRPRSPETHTLSVLVLLGLEMPQKPRPAALTLREAEAAGNTSDVDVEQQLPGEAQGGHTLPDVLLPDVPLHGARLDGSIDEE